VKHIEHLGLVQMFYLVFRDVFNLRCPYHFMYCDWWGSYGKAEGELNVVLAGRLAMNLLCEIQSLFLQERTDLASERAVLEVASSTEYSVDQVMDVVSI
jgi:hypothetical protein